MAARVPPGLDDRGRRLWRVLMQQHPQMTSAEKETALQACRTADLLDRLDEQVRRVDPVVETEKGGLVTHPAVVEQRQQSALLARLIAALRLPDARTGDRPIHRQVRGVQQPSRLSTEEPPAESMRDRLALVAGG